MKWTGRRQSNNIEDRRRMSGGKQVAFGGGLVGIIIFVVFYFLGGGDSAQLLQELQQQTTQSSNNQEISIDPAEDEMAQFVAVALADNEDVWNRIFSENGQVYKEPKLVLYRGYTQSACGNASAASGPFYCPADSKVYFDLSFLKSYKQNSKLRGRFRHCLCTRAWIGHHVQNLLGTAGEVYKKQQQVSDAGARCCCLRSWMSVEFSRA